MIQPPFVLSTKLVPPRVKSQCLRRQRLDELFLQIGDYPVTLVQADAGYGKSTALVTHLCTQFDHVAWYSVESGERDALLFLHYLIHALKRLNERIGERSLRLFGEADSVVTALQPGLTLLLNDLAEWAPEETVIVLDDFHTVADSPEIQTAMDWFIRYLPPNVHLVFGSRKALELPSIRRLQATYDLLFIDKRDLLFEREEIAQLFQEEYGISLPSEQIQALQEQTEGWIIALQMIWKGLEQGVRWLDLGREQPETGRPLFDYLAEEVFDRQPELLQQFLTSTSLLEAMTPDVCDLLMNRQDSAEILLELEREGLFVTGVDGHYRYHRLFQQFLITRSKELLPTARWCDLHRLAADYFQEKGDWQQALHHAHQAGELAKLVDLLLQWGAELLQNGRLELMKRWIDRLPHDRLMEEPQLLYWRGEIDRVRSRFNEAERWYAQAEQAYRLRGDTLGQSLVYRGLAQVYLDTIQPNKAVPWLQKAVQVLGEDHPAERAMVLRQLAENHTNSGQLQEAEAALSLADQLVPGRERDELDVRLHLRTGRLQTARQMTLEIIAKESEWAAQRGGRIAKSHRELHLLLSLIDALIGEVESSRLNAEKGIEMGKELQSPFVELVGHMRLGHAVALAGDLEAAQECYQQSIQMSENLSVERGKVEALMGLCYTTGLLGEVEQAEIYARRGLELALNVQDHWCANMIRLALGLIYTVWGHDEEALNWLLAAEADFERIGDPFLLANARLWLCILYERNESEREFARVAQLLLQSVEAGGYEDLFRRRTLFGPPDLQMPVSFLIRARDQLKLESAERILRKIGCKGVQRHPGYTLRIYTLGNFVVYRGLEEVERKEWKREKSRQLFQLLVTRSGQLLQRDEIYDLLWPDVEETIANRDFKVAMNALTHAIEPKREARSDSFFIERLDTAYRLTSSPAVWVDVEEFKAHAEKGLFQSARRANLAPLEREQALRELRAALALYKGDFLQHYPYLDWCADERERNRTLYLRVLERMALLHQEQGAWQDAAEYGELILQSDPCWEAAYQILMNAYHHLGHRNLVISTYKKCLAQLEDQLGLAPMPETTRLYQQLVYGNRSGSLARNS